MQPVRVETGPVPALALPQLPKQVRKSGRRSRQVEPAVVVSERWEQAQV